MGANRWDEHGLVEKTKKNKKKVVEIKRDIVNFYAIFWRKLMCVTTCNMLCVHIKNVVERNDKDWEKSDGEEQILLTFYS